jgi:hypothetical protein
MPLERGQDSAVQDRLLFVVSPPRSGSTLLQRLIGSHSQVFTHPEPHLITPLAHLGYYANVEKAPYDHINAAEALKLFVSGLPRQEEDYLDALRAYADTMYGRILEPTGKRFFMDKTPANALVLPFLAKLYPHAKYVVLTRHPLAIFSSYANSFFDGSWARAHEFNPIVERYVPAMARFLRERPVPLHHVVYEELVQAPEEHLARVFEYLGLPNEPGAVEYGKKFQSELAADPGKLALAQQMIERLDPADLATWGLPKERAFDALANAGASKPPERVLNGYTLQRKVMLALKKNIHTRPHGKLIQKVRYYCDVLLRE